MTASRILLGCMLFAFAVSASAQTKFSTSGSCTKADTQQVLPAGDKPDHMFVIAQGKCTSKSEVGGATEKEASFTEHGDMGPMHYRSWGIYAATFESGDKIFYAYDATFMTKDKAIQSGKNSYHAVGGTGKFKGIKATGTCTYTAGADMGVNFSCDGEYTLGGGAMMKGDSMKNDSMKGDVKK